MANQTYVDRHTGKVFLKSGDDTLWITTEEDLKPFLTQTVKDVVKKKDKDVSNDNKISPTS